MNKIYAIYDDEEILIEGIKKLKSNNVKIHEVYTPFPVHGLDKVLGLKFSRLGVCAFIYGMCGLCFAMLMMGYMMTIDWPQIIGGKPNFSFFDNIPTFIPIMFECTVLFSAHLLALTFMFRSKLFPGAKSRNPDPRTTDDKFLVELHVDDNYNDIINLVKKTNVSEIKTSDEKED